MKRKNDRGQFDFGIYEVFFDEHGKVKGHTEKSLGIVCNSEDDLKEELKIMMEAFDKETLTYDDDQ